MKKKEGFKKYSTWLKRVVPKEGQRSNVISAPTSYDSYLSIVNSATKSSSYKNFARRNKYIKSIERQEEDYQYIYNQIDNYSLDMLLNIVSEIELINQNNTLSVEEKDRILFRNKFSQGASIIHVYARSTDINNNSFNEFFDRVEKAGCVENILNFKDNIGATPLHVAVFSIRANYVKRLLAAGANPLALDNKGFTPLDYASLSLTKTNSPETREIFSLLENSILKINSRYSRHYQTFPGNDEGHYR